MASTGTKSVLAKENCYLLSSYQRSCVAAAPLIAADLKQPLIAAVLKQPLIAAVLKAASDRDRVN